MKLFYARTEFDERCEGSQHHVHPCSDTKGKKDKDAQGVSNPSFVRNSLEYSAQEEGNLIRGDFLSIT